MISATIRGVTVTVGNASFRLEDPLEDRAVLTFTVLDENGTATYTRGDPVTFEDPDPDVDLNYIGYVQSDQPTKAGLILPFVEHVITCMDGVYSLGKRSNSQNYFNWQAGNIVIDFVKTTLADEGITIAAASHRDTTTDGFNQGNLNGLAGGINALDDGDLEVALAGSVVTITENTTGTFASGTLTNMTATGNALVPTTVNAIKMQSTLSFSYGVEFAQEQQTASGTTSGTTSGSASYSPAGTIFISGGNPGESATFSGSLASIPISVPVSTSVSANVSPPHQPKVRSRVKVDARHHDVITVDAAVADNRVDATIWTGSMTIASNDTLNYGIWISSTSPSQEGGVDLSFSDGTTLTEYLGTLGTNNDVGVWDQNLLSVSPIQDLSDAAKDTWYTRQINLSLLAGKTITSVSVFNAANVAGTFDLYIKNCYLGSQSGSPFFGLTSTAPSVNPPTISMIGAYINSATIVTVAPVYDPVASVRVSPAYSIDAVGLIKDSVITWEAANPVFGPAVIAGSAGVATIAGNEAIFVSYDGTTWLPCTNNASLPCLPAGANVSGVSLYLMETFTGGQDPTAVPSLRQVSILLNPAPKATTTDIVSQYGSTSSWNTGTELGTAPNTNGDLVLGNTSYSWSNTNNMTYVTGNVSASNPTQSVSSGAYVISYPGGGTGEAWSDSRFDFISAAQNFTLQADFTLNGGASPIQNEIGFVYRQTYWGSPRFSYAYYVRLMQAPGGQAGGTSISLGYGVNNQPATPNPFAILFNSLAQVSETITNNTTYHVKVVVAQNRHTIYWNNGTTPVIDILDNTYTAAGNIGVRTFVQSSNSTTVKIANFQCTNTFAGLWTSPSINLNSLGTCGNTQICWSEVNPTGSTQSTAIVMASLNGGTTWAQCTNGSVTPTATIPGLPSGTSVTGKSLLIQIILSATSYLSTPIIEGLCVRVCGAYPGASGTRDTTPMGNDTQITRTVGSGWGTAFDGQTWTQTGTGTTAVGSGVATIANTTGDVHMRLGSRTSTDEEATVRFKLSASTIAAGMELRYSNTSNFYRLSISTTAITIYKQSAGVFSQLATVANSLSTNTWYWMRFRVTGSGPVTLQAKVWLDGVIEPGVLLGVMSSTNPQWSITAID